jgi:hypothetical protein
MRIAGAVLVLSVASACGPTGCSLFGPDPRALGADGGPCRLASRRFDRYLTPGQPAQFRFGLFEACIDQNGKEHDVATEVKVEILDPNGKPFPHFASGPIRVVTPSAPNVFENVVEVLFTPDQPGTWRLTASFEPGIGETGQEIEAIEWRGDAGVHVIDWAVPRGCREYGMTDLGTAVCFGGQPGQVELETHRGQSMKAQSFALEHDTLWRVTYVDGGSSLVERLVDDGVSFRTTHAFGETFVGTGVIALRGDEAWLFGGYRVSGTMTLRQLRPQDGGTISSDKIEIPGKHAVSVTVGPGGALLGASDGERQSFMFASREGVVSKLVDAGMTTPLASDSVAFWMSAEEQNAVLNWQATDLGLATVGVGGVAWIRMQLPHQTFNFSISGLAAVPLVPMERSEQGPTGPAKGIAVPRLAGSRIALEMYDAGSDFGQVVSATRTHAFAVALDGGSLKVFAR